MLFPYRRQPGFKSRPRSNGDRFIPPHQSIFIPSTPRRLRTRAIKICTYPKTNTSRSRFLASKHSIHAQTKLSFGFRDPAEKLGTIQSGQGRRQRQRFTKSARSRGPISCFFSFSDRWSQLICATDSFP